MEPIERIEITEQNGKRNSSRYHILSTVLWCVLAFALGIVFCMHISGTTLKELELKTLINTFYDGSFNSDIAEDYEMAGIVSGLKDKNSFYITAKEMVPMSEDISGKFGGIGVEVSSENSAFVIKGITKGSPADKNGLLTGDIIVSVDGVNTEQIPFEEVTEYIRGEIGTEVRLGIKRNDKVFEIALIREQIEVKSVEATMLEGGVAYVSVKSFDEDTDKELDTELSKFKYAKGVVLDLRNNPGGFLYVCADAVDLFLEKDKTIVKACYKNSENVMKTEKEAKFEMPMVVLINEFSASSSEIFSSCMQDNKRATIVGTKSYGKGSIQRTHEFKDGSGVNLTVGHFYSPNGKKIDGIGVTPDIEVELNGEEDLQLEKAIEILKQK